MHKCHKHGKYLSLTIVLVCISIAIFVVYDMSRLQMAQASTEKVSERYSEAERENDENPEQAKYHESIACASPLLLLSFNTVFQTHSFLLSFPYNCIFREVPSRAPPRSKS